MSVTRGDSSDTAYAINRPTLGPGKAHSDDPLIGQQVDHFLIRGLLGQGGMGRVYLAHDLSLERPVALKMLRPELANEKEIVARLTEEARAQARIQHPHVVGVYFVGEHEKVPYIAMEYVEGENLAEFLAHHGPLGWKDALEVVIQVARALFHAHLKHFSHRDVKPSNIIFTQGKQYRSNLINVKVADFGLAAPVGHQEEQFMGTPRYAAPEFLDGSRPDHRSDIYSLGITFYELLTGKVPFDADSLPELFEAHREKERPAIPESAAPWRLRQLITQMMAANPMNRPATYEDLLESLISLRHKPVAVGGLPVRAVALAVDLAIVVGIGQVLGDQLYLHETTTTQLTLLLFALYNTIGHAFWGATPGKKIMGLRLQGVRHAIGLPRMIGRFLVQFWGPILAVAMISLQVGVLEEMSDMSQLTGEVVGKRLPMLQQTLEPLLRQVLLPNLIVALPWLSGFVYAILDRNRMALHDHVASTKVVYTLGDGPAEMMPRSTTSLRP